MGASYESYLRALLEPLGIYDFTAGSASESELYALGAGMDVVGAALDTCQRESMPDTACAQGLSLREALFARKPAAPDLAHRRAAIAALLNIGGDSLTPDAMERTLAGCGIRARVEELDAGHLRVRFPDVAGEPDDVERIEEILLDILPCHLAVGFFFRYLTWQQCEDQAFTWAVVETAEYTWETFQKAIQPEP
jgi:hypothetical protein